MGGNKLAEMKVDLNGNWTKKFSSSLGPILLKTFGQKEVCFFKSRLNSFAFAPFAH